VLFQQILDGEIGTLSKITCLQSLLFDLRVLAARVREGSISSA
jgi:hypothetical protein